MSLDSGLSVQKPERSAPRTDQACRSCRQLKARCKPSDVPSLCQRCRDFNRACLWPETRTRHRNRRSAALVSAGEEHRVHDRAEHSAVLGSRHHRGSGGTDSQSPASERVEDSTVQESTPTSLDQLAQIHNFTEHFHSNGPIRESASFTISYRDIFRGLVTDDQLEGLLNDYRPMSSAFPFVPIKSGTTVQMLRRTKPMLLLAIAAAASWKDRKLQAALDQRYREELASDAIVKPHKSVGLVQSLLVYLAWYHYFFSHKVQNIVPLVHLLVGLTVDIGLYRSISNRNAKGPAAFTPEERRERDRALLGCYFSSSVIAGALRKPNFFKKTYIIEECLLRLQNSAESDIDTAIKSLVESRALDDRVSELCQALYSQNPLPLDCDRLRLFAELTRWKGSLSMNPSNGAVRTCDFLHDFAHMELCNTNLREASDGDSLLSQCLNAGKSFLDTLLDHPVNTYHLIPFAVWMRLPLVIITLSTLTNASNSTQSSTLLLPGQIRLDLYLEALCNRMQILTTCQAPHQPIPDFWKAMYVIMDQARLCYVDHARRSVVADSSAAAEGLEQPNAGSTQLDDVGSTSMWEDFMVQDIWGGFDGFDPTIEGFDGVYLS